MVPIIRSLLDTDFYKFTMGQLIWKLHRDVPTVFRFTNRHAQKVRLAEIVTEGELRAELEHARTLRFTHDEIAYLAGIKNGSAPMFCEGYLAFLADLRLPEFSLSSRDGQFELSFSGKWSEATYWEIPALATVNELYYRSLMMPMSRSRRAAIYAEGALRRDKKIAILKEHPDITWTDFGTRRRHSGPWQSDEIVAPLARAFPPTQFLGTSNVLCAWKHGVKPSGTKAHELDMGYSGIYHGSTADIRASHQRMLHDWWDMYGHGLSVALTDTYGTDFFFRDFSPEQAREWKGFRQDSGDPIVFGEKTIRFYEAYGIDPREKLIVPSDGLNIDTMVRIAAVFKRRITTTFGLGTNGTNDLGLAAISIVVKLMEANGHGTVKLSDNLAKAIGAPKDVERFKRIFGYSATFNEACTY